MAKLGTKKKPVVVRVQTEERGQEIAAICAEHGCHYIIGLEPDKSEDISDVDRLLNPSVTKTADKKIGRNAPLNVKGSSVLLTHERKNVLRYNMSHSLSAKKMTEKFKNPIGKIQDSINKGQRQI